MTARPDNPLSRSLVLAVFVALFCVPFLVTHEPAQWKAAWAMRQYDMGNRTIAIETLQGIAPTMPRALHVQQTLVNWLCDNDMADQAVEHCNQMKRAQPEYEIVYLALRQVAEASAGRFDDAYETHQSLRQLSRQSVQRDPEELNQAAYFRALAERDLLLARDEIKEAVKRSPGRRPAAFRIPLSSQAVVAAAMLSRNTKFQALPRQALDQQILISQAALGDRETLVVDTLLLEAAENFPLAKQQEADAEEFRLAMEFRRRELAILRSTRALLWEDLGHPDRCDYDRAQVIELGLDPQKTLDLIPDEATCRAILDEARAFLDTQGFVMTQLYRNAVEDDRSTLISEAVQKLNVAVMAATTLMHYFDRAPESKQITREQNVETLATLLKHRAQAHQLLGEAALAEADWNSMRKLGFEPEANLF